MKSPLHPLTLTSLCCVCFLLLHPPANGQQKSDSPQVEINSVRANVQKICPVSGLELGAHGPPIKVKIGGEYVFICCESCKTGKVNKEHWTTIHQKFAKAQAKCLVMDNPLPKNSKWVIVKGHLIYVCCPPCIEKIKEAPDEYVNKLNDVYSRFIAARDSNGEGDFPHTRP